MVAGPKKHHFIPQSVLRRFSIDGDGKKIYVFDKLNDRCWLSAITDAGSENHFNSLEFQGVRVSFEHLFQDIDDRLATLLNRLLNDRTLASFGPEDRAHLADVIAVQLLRTKLIRTSMQAVARELAQSLANAGFDPDGVGSFRLPTEQDVKMAALEMLSEREVFRMSLITKLPVLIDSSESERFLISDNPIVMSNSFPYGQVALDAPGIEIYYPIAPDLTLGFFCKSIMRKLEDAVAKPPGAIPAEMRERFAGLRAAILSGTPTSLAANAPQFLNELQIRRSSRFLYASADDFDVARAVVRRHPRIRSVETIMSVGRMGAGPPRRSNMPQGLWLVVYGRSSHHMLPVEDVDERSPFIEASTPDVATLAAILRDRPLQQAMLFENGAERHGMRQIKIELVGQSLPQRLRVLHNDDSLNAAFARDG